MQRFLVVHDPIGCKRQIIKHLGSQAEWKYTKKIRSIKFGTITTAVAFRKD